MERLTKRDGKQVLYVKDGEAYPYPLMSHYDVQRVLNVLCDFEDAVECGAIISNVIDDIDVALRRCDKIRLLMLEHFKKQALNKLISNYQRGENNENNP